MLPSIAVVAFPMFVKLRCIERSVFGHIVPDQGTRGVGGTMSLSARVATQGSAEFAIDLQWTL
jgi:hypothetical protein